ncbi:hypothetical protein ABE61_08220 [Lysinibacillus sphaericus]|nr:hypothetical protein [Lysinibacillus sphaericus]MBG9479355.1 hypothetical protein [Lysinibacillus sphaericus]MBG9593447.1 hypothetical protein [Lysinibacillus sphaericus]
MMILILSGSPRKNSINSGLAKYIQNAYEQYNVESLIFDLSSTQLPLFTDEESDYDNENVQKLLKYVEKATSIVICTPEYHNAVSGALKNCLDFLNRDHFFNKKILMFAAGCHGKGGINALNNLRLIMRGVAADVSPQQHVIDGEYFDEKQNLVHEEHQLIVKELIYSLV